MKSEFRAKHNQIYKRQSFFRGGQERKHNKNSSNRTIFAMNEVIYQGISHSIKELLLGGMNAKYLFK